jgi:hypothetical protein
MPRRIYERKVNLPEDFTNLIHLFTLFYPRKYVETFVRSTNKYAEKEIKLERRRDSELFFQSRYFN